MVDQFIIIIIIHDAEQPILNGNHEPVRNHNLMTIVHVRKILSPYMVNDA